MNRDWVSGSRLSVQYDKGIMDFCAFASSYASTNNIERVYCPCKGCWNNKKVKPKKLRKHLLLKGIDPQYKFWYMHGEVEPQNVQPQPVESLPVDNDDWEEDNIIDMVNNVADDFVARPQVLESLRNDSELPLYEGCSKYTRLSATLKIFNLKAKNGWSDVSFTELLTLVKDMLPEDNTLPNRCYEAKKVMCPMGIDYEKIHACPNDCILYRNSYKDMVECPVCKSPRYKLNKEPKNGSKGTPSKVLWYLPPIPRFQRLFASLEDSDNMRWHAEKRVIDMKMRAMLMCTINDFPAYGNLSGYSIKGYKACPICGEETHARHLKNCRKMVYMGHRRFLSRHHPYRRKKAAFNGETEHGIEPRPASGDEILQKIQNITNRFGKPNARTEGTPWKKRSIFFDLPYWHTLDVRHCIDVMHVEKNICDSLIGTLLNIPGKTKDGLKARLDMLDMNIRTKLAPQTEGKRTYLPPSCTTLSKNEKTILCGCLKGVKVPYGYSSNIASLVSMKDLRLNGLKSHDYHVLIQQLLPIAIRGAKTLCHF
ncbi:unnamed protein product [Rhodiola kirilowii]